MFGSRKVKQEWPEPVPVVHQYDSTAKEAGEHEALARLQRARAAHERASRAYLEAERLTMDADEEIAEARKEMRRISER